MFTAEVLPARDSLLLYRNSGYTGWKSLDFLFRYKQLYLYSKNEDIREVILAAACGGPKNAVWEILAPWQSLGIGLAKFRLIRFSSSAKR
jgi:hypothetical protein